MARKSEEAAERKQQHHNLKMTLKQFTPQESCSYRDPERALGSGVAAFLC